MLCRCTIGVLVLISFSFQVKVIVPHECDMGRNTFKMEGRQGVVRRFPWLGVIRVTLYEGAKIRTAVTGAVLVTSAFAIANAEDIIKIPKKIFRDDTKAMFIPSDNSSMNYELKGYTAHPEFKDQTSSTIALVELQFDITKPLIPICWPRHYYEISRSHYAVGYDDERLMLEKVAYQVQYVNKSHCRDYYNSLELYDHQYVPAHYQCWMAPSLTQNCLWENGMVLVSNSSGTWVLIGIGIRGPGCAAPVRFIELHPYLPWIESVVNFAAFRRSSVNQNKKPRLEDIPAHHFFRKDNIDSDVRGLRRRIKLRTPPPSYRKFTKSEEEAALKPESRGETTYLKEHWFREDIHRIDKDAIIIGKFGEKFENKTGDCIKASYLAYRETIKVTAYPQVMGQATYKLSLIELKKYDYNCVVLRVKSRHRSDCYLWYSVTDTIDEPLEDEMPDHLLKHYIPVEERVPAGPFEENIVNWEPHQNLEAFHLKDGDPFDDSTRWWKGQPMFNLLVKFDFREKAELMLEVWGPRSPYITPMPGEREEREKRRNITRTRRPYHSNTRRRRPTTSRTRTKSKRKRPPVTTVPRNTG